MQSPPEAVVVVVVQAVDLEAQAAPVAAVVTAELVRVVLVVPAALDQAAQAVTAEAAVVVRRL